MTEFHNDTVGNTLINYNKLSEEKKKEFTLEVEKIHKFDSDNFYESSKLKKKITKIVEKNRKKGLNTRYQFFITFIKSKSKFPNSF